MNKEKALSVVMDPYIPVARVGVGFYLPTPSFLAQKEHVAVMDEANGGLLAITGAVDPSDEENNFRSLCEAVVYAGAFEMFDLIKKLAAGDCSSDYAEIEAKTILESLRHKMDGLEPRGCSPEGLRNSILHKLGLIRAEIRES